MGETSNRQHVSRRGDTRARRRAAGCDTHHPTPNVVTGERATGDRTDTAALLANAKIVERVDGVPRYRFDQYVEPVFLQPSKINRFAWFSLPYSRRGGSTTAVLTFHTSVDESSKNIIIDRVASFAVRFSLLLVETEALLLLMSSVRPCSFY